MKQLTVPYIATANQQGLDPSENLLQLLPQHSMNETPWPAYPYKPAVQFTIAHDGSHIFLKYWVTEKAIRAVNSQPNSSVWEDSCVEFFISIDDTAYYNFEFNCMGIPLVGYGASKTQRSLLPEATVMKIATRSLINRLPGNNNLQWELTVRIPITTFIHHQPVTLSGLNGRANFYKCGDLLPEPHFVTWADIETPEPDFHRPAHFGQLHFE
jgi:hypothetical protein